MMTDILKNRSYLSCIATSFVVFSDNFLLLLKKTWMWIVLLTVINCVNTILGRYFLADTSVTIWAIAKILYSIFVCVCIAKIQAGYIGIITKQMNKQIFKRTLKISALTIFLVMVSITILSTIIVSSTIAGQTIHMAYIAIAILLVALLLLLVLSPYSYSITKYLITSDETFKLAFFKDYVKGWKAIGFLSTANLILCLISTIALAILLLPVSILAISSFVDMIGIEMGDISGLPTCYWLYLAIGSTLTTIGLTIYLIWAGIYTIYVYGNVETDMMSADKTENDNQQKNAQTNYILRH